MVRIDANAYHLLGKPTLASKSFLREDEYFEGDENAIVYKRYYEMTLNCEMELQQFPFDNQTCFIAVIH